MEVIECNDIFQCLNRHVLLDNRQQTQLQFEVSARYLSFYVNLKCRSICHFVSVNLVVKLFRISLILGAELFDFILILCG
jgi:hypothetical protein